MGRDRQRRLTAPIFSIVLALATSDCRERQQDPPPASARDTSLTMPAALVPAVPTDTIQPLWLIGPGGAAGEVSAQTSEDDLVRRFGAVNVRRDTVWLAEGAMSVGTVLFADDSTRRLEIIWQDTSARARPGQVRALRTGSRWSVAPGVSVGSSLTELERVNGRPFTLTGFDWDYAGTVLSCGEGSLASLPSESPRVLVRLAPTKEAQSRVSSRELGRVQGDREFASSDPVTQRLDPRVYEISLLYR